MTQETKWPAPGYDIGDLVKVKSATQLEKKFGIEVGGIYHVLSSNSTELVIMTTQGVRFPLKNRQVERWGE